MGLSRRQKLALNRSVAPINLWFGSVRASKTYAQVWDFIARMSTAGGDGVNLVIGHSTNTVWRNMFLPIISRPEFKVISPHLKYRQNAPSGSLFGKPFSVVGAQNESSWVSIQGMTVLNAWGDEAVSWPESFWDMLVSRLSLPESRLLATCNPGSASHYLKRRVVDQADTDPDIHIEKFLLADNPTIPPRVQARLGRMYTGLFYDRMILGRWVAAEGTIYDTWDPSRMVTTGRDGTVLAIGIDYGVQHPTAGYALTMRDDGALVISHEWAPNEGIIRLTDAQLADSLQAWLESLPNQPRTLYVDPSALSFRQELKARGVQTAAAKNAVVAGIQTVHSELTGGRLTVHESCTRLIEEIPGYVWDKQAEARGVDAPVKEHDDHVDALRYAVYSSRHLWRRTAWQPAASSTV